MDENWAQTEYDCFWKRSVYRFCHAQYGELFRSNLPFLKQLLSFRYLAGVLHGNFSFANAKKEKRWLFLAIKPCDSYIVCSFTSGLQGEHVVPFSSLVCGNRSPVVTLRGIYFVSITKLYVWQTHVLRRALPKTLLWRVAWHPRLHPRNKGRA